MKKVSSSKNAANESVSHTGFALNFRNYKLMLIGFAIIVIGFVLMSGGKSAEPDVFNGEALYGFRRTTLATVVVLLGFVFEMYAIMTRPKKQQK
ncbi:hypothetical protein AGMMS4956_18980 [Bacteroidia bacterium]|nr:hypothetical protein AGMMS4956_18980 [Bacteroidia bacterium]